MSGAPSDPAGTTDSSSPVSEAAAAVSSPVSTSPTGHSAAPIPVAALVHRLAKCPDDFLAPPLVGREGSVSVAAVLGDVVAELDAHLPEEWIEATSPPYAATDTVRWLQAVLVACWLAADPTLRPVLTAPRLLGLLSQDLRAVSDLVDPADMVRDPDRREELARLLLRAVGATPAGETPEAAADRLATLDTVSRTRVEAEARAAEERATQVREAMAAKRAAEAAARASRE